MRSCREHFIPGLVSGIWLRLSPLLPVGRCAWWSSRPARPSRRSCARWRTRASWSACTPRGWPTRSSCSRAARCSSSSSATGCGTTWTSRSRWAPVPQRALARALGPRSQASRGMSHRRPGPTLLAVLQARQHAAACTQAGRSLDESDPVAGHAGADGSDWGPAMPGRCRAHTGGHLSEPAGPDPVDVSHCRRRRRAAVLHLPSPLARAWCCHRARGCRLRCWGTRTAARQAHWPGPAAVGEPACAAGGAVAIRLRGSKG